MALDIVEFTARFEDLLDETEASYIEIIGTLEIAKQRLLADALTDEDYEEEDEDEDYEEDEDEDEEEDDEDWE